jgi:putative pyoverdin transport system ATP-binding/permease protein
MNLMRLLLHHSRFSLFTAVVAGAISGVCNTAFLVIINAGAVGSKSIATKLLLAFVTLCLVAPVSRTMSELLLVRLGQGALVGLRMNLSRQILGVPLAKLEQIGTPKLLAVLTEDVTSITNLLTNLPALFINSAVVVTCLIFMSVLNWHLFLVVFAFLIAGTVGFQALVSLATNHLTSARQEHNKLLGHFRSLLSGIKELKMHRERREVFAEQLLAGSLATFRQRMIAGMNIYTAASSVGELLVFLALGLLVFWAPTALHLDQKVVFGFALAMLYMVGPLESITRISPQIGRASAALKNIDGVGLQLAGLTSDCKAPELTAEFSTGRLEVSDLTYAYESNEGSGMFVLGPISLTFEPGEMTFITGGNGSGKTTLAKLITGLYRPQSGEIRLNGRTISDNDVDAYRQSFSVVFSDFYLFETLLGLDGQRLDEQAHDYLVQLHLSHKVKIQDGALSTTDLSQGQRKRLALLTAYLEDRPIYFFDEWAADQDPVFKEIFYYQLLPTLKAKGKMVLIISHDDRFYSVGDRVIKLDSGQVVGDERQKPVFACDQVATVS